MQKIRKIQMKELRETVEDMNSPDYTRRMAAEYAQLKIRFVKLKKMLEEWDDETLPYTPNCPRGLYNLQIRAMADYLAVLEARAVIEGITLSV
ncbi:hypothetical protein CXIVA_01820 [Clostridium sp. SY8519]|nr:hypothetical protein CXIVA_01820 [Clostridium sp. SY8519]